MNARKYLNGLGLLMALSVILAACQPQAIQPTPAPIVITSVVTQIVAGTPVEKVVEKLITPTPVPPTPVPAVSPTPVPQPVDSIVIALQQEPDTLHPLLGSMSSRTYVQNMLLVGCMGQNEKAEWVPLGCERVPSVENGDAKLVGDGDDKHLEVTYKIRKDWRWNDGQPVTTADILYWWHLYMDPAMPVAARTGVEKIYDIQAVDDKTAVVKYMSKKQVNEVIKGTLKGSVDFKSFQPDYQATFGTSWDAYLVDPVFWNNIGWLPEHILKAIAAADQAGSDYARQPLGDGPYILKEWKAGQELRLEKSDKPFPLGDPKVKTVTFRIFGDAAGVLAALKTGEVDAAAGNVGGLTESEAPDLDAIEAQGRIKVWWNKGWDFEHIDLNTQKFPFNDPLVREALAYATNPKEINDAVYNGKRLLTDLPLPPGVWAYPPESELVLHHFDLDKAKALLQQAGWDCTTRPCLKNGQKLEFTLLTTDRPSRVRAAQILMNQWQKINVGVNVQFLYGRGLFNTCQTGGPLYCRTFDAAMYTFSSDDSATFYGLYSCASIPTEQNAWSGQNSPGWCNQPAVDALNKSENDPEIALSQAKRLPYITTFFKEYTKDVPVIVLFAAVEPYPHLVNWKNWKQGPTQYSYFTWNSWEWEISK